MTIEEFVKKYYHKVWYCEVMRSGYHNGATCTPNDPHHDSWHCHYRYESALTEAGYEKFTHGTKT